MWISIVQNLETKRKRKNLGQTHQLKERISVENRLLNNLIYREYSSNVLETSEFVYHTKVRLKNIQIYISFGKQIYIEYFLSCLSSKISQTKFKKIKKPDY